jgi:hypothetical protein
MLLFEHLDCLARRGWRDAEAHGRSRKTAQLGHGKEDADGVQRAGFLHRHYQPEVEDPLYEPAYRTTIRPVKMAVSINHWRNMMMLPNTVQQYLQAANAHDAVAVAACFSEQGTVRDEGRTHQGHAAIRAWHSKTSADYAVTATALAWKPHAHGGVVTAQVAGNFPGSPLALSFNFTFGAHAIDQLEITA